MTEEQIKQKAQENAGSVSNFDLNITLMVAENKIDAYRLGRNDGFIDGYHECQKEHEWHYVKDGDLPEVDNKIVLCVCGNGYIDGKRNYKLKLLTRKEFPLFQPVYAWKEIVPPKEIE